MFFSHSIDYQILFLSFIKKYHVFRSLSLQVSQVSPKRFSSNSARFLAVINGLKGFLLGEIYQKVK